MDVPRREEACRGVPTQKDHKQALLAARVMVRVFWMLLWPRRDQDVANYVRRQRGHPEVKEPSQKQAAPAEVPEQTLQRGVNRSSPEVTKEDSTTLEDNSGGCALQVRVSGTQAWLCTKEILGECTGAGAVANHAVPSNAV
ncbi:hypothetical protein NDU88_004923 [Pleurodeles waltl]|uniref:Uncharacterized protein n=1 Tax=Pleurodeles waltl TaxID=8319 RepID=A0AAV7RI81_PLEWA|nr:hypothetical protein NDU88_004923 [Pleurodeles waltl]